jgi:ABC-2 type transport system permease protein
MKRPAPEQRMSAAERLAGAFRPGRNTLAVLLRPGRTALKRFFTHEEGVRWGRFFLAAFFTLVVCGLIFALTVRGVRFVSQVEVIGMLLAARLLEMTLLSLLAFVFLSSLATVLSTFYLADDLSLLRSLPATEGGFFTARWFQTSVLSGWMVLGFGMPVLMAYGYALGAGADYLWALLIILPPLLLIPTAIGVMLITVLVCVFPARRVRELFLVFGVLAAASLLLIFRAARPERLMNPEVFGSVANYVSAFEMPQSAFLPSTWAAETLQGLVVGEWRLMPLLLLWGAVWGLGSVAFLLHRRLYGLAYTRAQEGGPGYFRQGRLLDRVIESGHAALPHTMRAFAVKDTKTLTRDPAQWSQLLLLLLLIVAYVYNYAVFPGARLELLGIDVNLVLGGFNLVLAGFVMSALVARFAFPAVSVEGRAFWLVRGAPVSAGRFLRIKFAMAVGPLLILAVLLGGVTAYWLELSPQLVTLSVVHIAAVTVVLTAMGVGLGGIYPRFRFENPAQVPMSFGGVIFMLVAMLYVLLAAAGTMWLSVPLVSESTVRAPWITVAGWFGWLTFHVLHATIPLHLGSRALVEKELE